LFKEVGIFFLGDDIASVHGRMKLG
jgi:hypothetical protein